MHTLGLLDKDPAAPPRPPVCTAIIQDATVPVPSDCRLWRSNGLFEYMHLPPAQVSQGARLWCSAPVHPDRLIAAFYPYNQQQALDAAGDGAAQESR